jgi:multidrug efflux pump subunit AcrB
MMLRKVLSQRLALIGIMLGLLVIAGIGFGLVPKQFMSASDRPQFMVYLDLPAGTHIDETHRATRQLSEWLADASINPDVKSSIAYVNSGGPRFYLALSPPDPTPYRSYLVVNTQSNDDVLEVMARVDAYLHSQMPGVRGRAEQLFMGPSSIGTVELRVSGPGLSTLKKLSYEVQEAFRKIPGSRYIRDDWDNPILKFRIEVDQELARRAGITSDDIANTLSSMIDGVQVTDFRDGDDIIPVVIRADDSSQERIDQLGTLSILSLDSGAPVPLLQVANIVGTVELPQIRRYDQNRTVTIYANHPRMQAAGLYEEALPGLEDIVLPPGYHISLGGELESSTEANSALFEYLPHCLLLIVLLLVFQFNSIRRPLIILSTIPLVLIGAVIGLLLTRVNFSFTGMLGLFSLAGIIVNNGIVLIDRIDQERGAGMSIHDAVVEACLARARPIVMTTLTTILGLLPLILFGGEFWIAMGIVIAFGLAVGSLLTLLFVPALYSLMFDNTLLAGDAESVNRPDTVIEEN